MKLTSAPEPVQFKLDGTSTVAVRRTKDGEEIYIDPDVRLSAKGAMGEQVAELEKSLSEPFVVELAGGKLVRYHQRAGTSTEVQAVRRFLASLMQHPSGEGRKAGASWTSEEWDGTGLYSVSYHVSETGELEWKHGGYQRYLYGVGEKQRDVPVEKLHLDAQGNGKSLWDARGLLRLERSAAITAPLPQGAKLRSEFRVTLGERQEVTVLSAEAWKEALRETEVVAVDTPPEAPRDNLANRLRSKGRNLEEVFQKLEEQELRGDQVELRERAETQGALAALMSENPLLAHQAEGKLAEGKLDAVLLESLSEASTEESLNVLLRAATNERFSKEKREKAARALIQAPHPPKAGLGLLLRLKERKEYSEHWLLGMGTFVRRYRESGDTEAAKSGTSELSAALSGPKSDEEREVALLAIANSGEASLYEKVEPYLKSEKLRLRIAALQAIRLMKDGRVEPVLRAVLTDKEPRVVSAALRALSRREGVSPGTIEVVRGIATKHKGADVRLEAVQALATWSRQDATLLEFLKKIGASDPDARVREAAGKMR